MRDEINKRTRVRKKYESTPDELNIFKICVKLNNIPYTVYRRHNRVGYDGVNLNMIIYPYSEIDQKS